MSTSRAAVVLAGRYRLEDWIATGGMGEVWAAADLVLRRPVAVKLVRAGYAEHPETLARFRAEARHAGSLSHPCIAQIYDYGEAEGTHPPFLVMELVDGPPLARLLAAGPLDPARVMDLVAQAAEGLAAAHAAGLVHRDVKPGNLLLAPGDRVKITDFGIAHAAGSAPITRTGILVGTPAYLAPERVAGAPATPASDLYSLGIVAYECLAGAPPFGGTAMEIALAHQLRPLPVLPPAVPTGAAALVAGLTAKDPAARPASAREVASRARHLRDGMPGAPAVRPDSWPGLSAAPGDAQYPTQPVTWQAYPSRTVADAEPATLAKHPATLIDSGTLGPPDPAERGRPPAGGHRRRRLALAVAAAAAIAGLAAWALAGPAAPQHGAPRPAHSSAAPAAPRSPAASMVNVNDGALAGHPVRAVVQSLRRLGLQVHVQWVRTRQQPPGTVVSVQPGGQVPARSGVTVTAALAPASHRGKHGHGHGGDGNGRGGD